MSACPKRSYREAFSLVEVLIALGVLAVLAGMGVATFRGSFQAASDGKLHSDVAALNSAVRVYQASGGDMSSADTAAKALTRLKSQSSAAQADRLTGVSSSVIDTRLAFRMQTQGEASAGKLRARWDTTDLQFVIAGSGDLGIKEFYLQEQGQVTIEDATDQRAGSMLFAEQSGWIWDYQDRAADTPLAPTAIPITTPAAAAPSIPPATVLPPPPVVPPDSNLAPPTLNQAGGSYALNLFPLAVTMTNPNAVGSSKIMYSVDAGTWQDYSGPLSVSPDSDLDVRSVPVVSGYMPSALASHLFEADSIPLLEPVITPDRATFGLFYQTDVTVTLSDPNQAGTSTPRYRVDGGAWQDYSTPFVLTKTNHPSGATIEAQAVSSGSPSYLPSPVAQQFVGRESLNLTGSTSGAFHDPIGQAGMITNLAGGNSNSLFQWGDATSQSGLSQSWMDYAGIPLTDISDGVRFNVGALTYYNGTIMADSGATTVDLAIELALDINGNTFRPFFDFTFELVNSPNTADEWASADFVRLSDPVASRTLVIDGNEFEFRVEFGETSADGFAAFNEFHVLENKDAAVNVYGTFISLGPVAGGGGGDPLAGTDKGGVVVATDAGTGTVADPIFQMNGYVDILEQSDSLHDIAKNAEEVAKINRDIAVDGLADALKGSEDISTKIDSGDYSNSAGLAVDAAAGAVEAEDAAKVAEAAAADAYDAAVAAKIAYGEALTDEDAKQAEDIAVKAIDHATQADAYATEARTAADEAAAYAAFTAAVVDNFEQEALGLSSGEEADDDDEEEGGSSATPEDYAEYLAAAAKTAAENAKKAWAEAEDAAKKAADYAAETTKMTNDIKFDEAEVNAANAINASTLAENAALRAEAAASEAGDAATKANSIASTNPLAASDATAATDEATLAKGYAVDARTEATAAKTASDGATAIVAANP